MAVPTASFVTIEAFNDTLDTNSTVTPDGAWKKYLDQEIAANEIAVSQAATWSTAFTVQMTAYFALWTDAVSDRDDVLDKQIEATDYVQTQSAEIDFPQMVLKRSVLTGAVLPELSACTDPLLYLSENIADGEVVDSEARKQSRSACGGVPAGWATHEGELYSTAAASYAGGLVHNANKRRVEGYRRNKTALVQQAQRSGVLALGPILAGYQQAAAIHEGLAGIFLQGFQSAGAGLGVSLDRLSTAQTTG